MPWSKTNYPPLMKDLDPAVRQKAVEIANALVHEGHDEESAIAEAMAKAEEWAQLQRVQRGRPGEMDPHRGPKPDSVTDREPTKPVHG